MPSQHVRVVIDDFCPRPAPLGPTSRRIFCESVSVQCWHLHYTFYRMMLSSSSPYSCSLRSSRASQRFRARSSTGFSGGGVVGGGGGAAAGSIGDRGCMLSAASAMTSIMRRFPLAFSLIGGATELEWEAATAVGAPRAVRVHYLIQRRQRTCISISIKREQPTARLIWCTQYMRSAVGRVAILLWCATVNADLYHRVVNAQHRGDLIKLCNRLNLTRYAAEVGVFRGGFSRHNLRHWHGEKYFMIDAWDFRANDSATSGGAPSPDKNTKISEHNEKNYRRALANVKDWIPPQGDRAIVLRLFSEAAVIRFPDRYFDFIYIDAGHEYRNALRDARVWWPKLRVGGMMGGDDFADQIDTFPGLKVHSGSAWGVKSAVSQFSREVGSPFFLTFADYTHQTTEYTSRAAEFDSNPPAITDDRAKRMPRVEELPPREHRVRPQRFYPAWYMFK